MTRNRAQEDRNESGKSCNHQPRSPTDQSEYRLARPERFPDGPATNATTSATVEDVLLRSNGSWKTPPKARDFEDALKGRGDVDDHIFVLGVFLADASFTDLIKAHAEGAYTWRRLAAALHRVGLTRHHHFSTLNDWAAHE